MQQSTAWPQDTGTTERMLLVIHRVSTSKNEHAQAPHQCTHAGMLQLGTAATACEPLRQPQHRSFYSRITPTE